MKKCILFLLIFNTLFLVYSQSRQTSLLTQDEFAETIERLMFEYNYCTLDVKHDNDLIIPNDTAFYSGRSDLPVVAMKRNYYVIFFTFTDYKPDIERIVETSDLVIEGRAFNTKTRTDYYAWVEYFNYLNEKYWKKN